MILKIPNILKIKDKNIHITINKRFYISQLIKFLKLSNYNKSNHERL